jgi:hypothetical protein
VAGDLVSRRRELKVHVDRRGALLPVDLDDTEFPIRRIFVVTAPEGGADRGGHEVTCRELVVLVGGRAEIHVGLAPDRLSGTIVLDRPGAGVHLEPGEFMAYRLDDASSILVLADEPYEDTERRRQP